jgi:hypothetical protein
MEDEEDARVVAGTEGAEWEWIGEEGGVKVSMMLFMLLSIFS